ncbi:RNA polymerase-binding protein DksA [Streptomyces sp. NPDC007025]|uniref:RNA polymerase-binding protein DksA n=1 Tax=Streptomyces sp. NPDC007025 TaxID=3364771 RepID=UPI003678A8A5
MTTEKAKTGQTMHGVEPYQETRGEEYMGEPMRKHFAKLLNAWKLELMTSVDRAVEDMKEEAANFPDPVERAGQEEEFALELRNRDRERKLIKKIDKTLDKIGAEEYGWCDACGIEIGLRRLEQRPTADLCFDCKEIAEKKEKTVGKG